MCSVLEDGITEIGFTTSKGTGLQLFEEAREGTTLYLRKAHIQGGKPVQGAKPGEVGLRELRDLAPSMTICLGPFSRPYCRGERTTEARPGKVQRPWVLDVD